MADWTCEQCGEARPSSEMSVTTSSDGKQLSCSDCYDLLTGGFPVRSVEAYAGP